MILRKGKYEVDTDEATFVYGKYMIYPNGYSGDFKYYKSNRSRKYFVVRETTIFHLFRENEVQCDLGPIFDDEDQMVQDMVDRDIPVPEKYVKKV